jgi:hypothetical protein
VKCSGKYFGCVVEAEALAMWHNDIALRWSHFMTDVRRRLNPGFDYSRPLCEWPVQVEFFKTYEEQARGALHIHSMMRVVGACTHVRFLKAVSEARKSHGFGPEMKCELIDLSDSGNAARKAGYCAKYSSKNADTLRDVRRVDATTGEVRTGGLRSWSASWAWGDKIKQVRQRRTDYGRALATVPLGDEWSGDGRPLDPYNDFYAMVESGLIVVVGESAPLTV